MKTYKHKSNGSTMTFKDGCMNIEDLVIEGTPNLDYWEEVVEKDYEVLSFKSLTPFKVGHIVQVSKTSKRVKEYLKGSKWTINSVKRLSDGEIFTIGDKVSFWSKVDIIERIYFNEHRQLSFSVEGDEAPATWVFGEKLSKVKRVSLFITEDGEHIYPGDSYWCVNTTPHLWSTFRQTAKDRTKLAKGILSFKDVSNAKQFVEDNKSKILFTTEDGVEVVPKTNGEFQYWSLKLGNWKIGDAPHILNSNKIVPTETKRLLEVCNELRFSTKTAAREYVLMNKPCLSINDIKENYGKYFNGLNNLKNLVNSRLPGKQVQVNEEVITF